jgi:chemotaxis protein methyltransferase CheR
MSAADHAFIRQLLRERAAIVLTESKGYLIDSRMPPLCRAHGLAGLSELVKELRRAPHGPLAQEVVEALTTNETSFYRDAGCFDALRERILPEIVERRRRARSINIWSAAASTGQEAYTLAMTIADMPELADWRIGILATDIDEKVLARARTGEYSQAEVNRGLPARQLVKHFEKNGARWRIRETLRRWVRFRRMNLAGPWPAMEPMDLILIRNVLIYFDTQTKRDVLTRARAVLRPGGYVLLGGSETTINLTDAYDRVRLGRTVAYRSAA